MTSQLFRWLTIMACLEAPSAIEWDTFEMEIAPDETLRAAPPSARILMINQGCSWPVDGRPMCNCF